MPTPHSVYLVKILQPIIKWIEFRGRCNLCNPVSIWSPTGTLGHNLLLKTVTYLLETWPRHRKWLIEWTQLLKQQQHATSVPHKDIVVFGRDLLQYTAFIRALVHPCFKKQEFLRFRNTEQGNVQDKQEGKKTTTLTFYVMKQPPDNTSAPSLSPQHLESFVFQLFAM